MSRPVVSVIMNCLNCAAYLREAIDSVYAQTYPNWEIIFWDNASTDGSAAIAGSYDDRLRYFKGDTTVLLGSARNRALAHAKGDVIAFLDCDDIWLREKLERQVSVLESRPEVDFVYSNFYQFEQGDGSKRLVLKGPQPEGYVFGPFLYSYRVGILTAMVRRSCLDRLDTLFDETFNLVEEFDLFMRVLYRSQAAYVSDPLASSRVHASNTSTVQRDRWVEEHHRAVAKLRRFDADGRFARAFDDISIRLELMAAAIHLSQGRSDSARKHIAPHKWHSFKSFALFLITFMPPRLWLALRPLWRRGVLYR